MSPEAAIRVVVVDDHPVVLAGVRAWCAVADPPITVVAAGPDVGVAWVGSGRWAPVVVVEPCHGGAPPAYADIEKLVDAGRRVVVYSQRDDNRTASACLEIGALSYLGKTEGCVRLLAAIRAAAAGRPYIAPSLVGDHGSGHSANRPLLTPRELDVLLLWFHCESKGMVAKKLGLSSRTVAGYIDRVRIKYADIGRPAPTKAALVARAIQDGLVSPEEL